MLSNTAVKITSLLFVALPAVLVGGEAYSYITGQPASNGFIKIYSVLLMIPGMHLYLTLGTTSRYSACCSTKWMSLKTAMHDTVLLQRVSSQDILLYVHDISILLSAFMTISQQAIKSYDIASICWHIPVTTPQVT